MRIASEYTKSNAVQEREKLFRALDYGIADMEAGRGLPIEEAFGKVTELRNMRRNAGT